jgi:glycosyltransferase involved in cell wall biosynthesis
VTPPRFSVVIPVYNRAAELRRALESLLAQTERNFEVIVCDDGSTEDIRAVVQPLTHALRLQYQRIPNSGGPARPRNKAIVQARGEWIAFLDSDDWWDPERLAVVDAVLSDEMDVLYHPLRVRRASLLQRRGERRRVIGHAAGADMLAHMLLFGNPLPNSAVVVRRSRLEQIGGISERPDIIEDFDTWLRLAAAGARFHFLDRTLGTYWVGEDGISKLSREQIGKYEATVRPYWQALHPAQRDLVLRCHHYHVGSMYQKLPGARAEARRHLLAARGLPTLAMRVKRLLRLLRTVGA